MLYLLHGYSDDQTAWQRWSSIECYVEGLNLAVVMPAVQNSFYSDMAHGGKFFTYVTEEVPALVHEIFPLSTERADTFVAGTLIFRSGDIAGAVKELKEAIGTQKAIGTRD